jgi:hypothetical protein
MGYQVDKTANLFPEGLAMIEVVECENKHSKKPPYAGYFKLKLRDVFSMRTLYENWMMEGAGQGMTVPKLAALELDLDREVEAQDLIGRRMIVRIRHKESEEYGMQAQIAKAWPVSKPPQEWKDANPEPGSPDLFDGNDEHDKPLPQDKSKDAPVALDENGQPLPF